MDKKKNGIPKLRFPGFTGAWEQRKVIDLLNQPITDGPHETPNLVEKGIPFISADAIVDNRIDFSRKRGFITKEYDLQCRKKYSPELYDVYLVKSGSTVGKVAIVETTKQFNIWSPLAAMRCKGKTNPYFLYFLFQIKENQNQVKSKASNGTQPNLSMREIEQFNVQIPSLHDEQKKIGEFFKQLNSLITLHQRKLDHLKVQKKGLLQKMFPKNGENVPEVRFPGFTDAWEQRRFKDISKLSQGLQIAISKRFTHPGDGKLFYITNEFLNPNSTVKYYIDSPTKNVIAERTDILMTRTGNTGKVVTDVEGVYHNNFFKISYNSSKIDRWFLYYLLNSYPIQREILVRAGNSTIPDLNHNDFYGIKIYIPTIEEQIKIGTFLTKVDSLIALHQRKLEHLELMKKGLLQQMFV